MWQPDDMEILMHRAEKYIPWNIIINIIIIEVECMNEMQFLIRKYTHKQQSVMPEFYPFNNNMLCVFLSSFSNAIKMPLVFPHFKTMNNDIWIFCYFSY